MKIDIGKLVPGKENVYQEDVSLNPEKFSFYPPLLEVKKLEVEARVHRYSDFINVDLSFKADVTLQCSYTLKPFASTLSDSDEIHFSNNSDDGDDMQIYTGNFINLDPYIFNLLSASIPTSPKAPNAKLPESGNGFRVLSEKEYLKDKEESFDPRFDALKDLEIE